MGAGLACLFRWYQPGLQGPAGTSCAIYLTQVSTIDVQKSTLSRRSGRQRVGPTLLTYLCSLTQQLQHRGALGFGGTEHLPLNRVADLRRQLAL